MKLVDFECLECRNIFEGDLGQKNVCPNCKTENIKRLWSPIVATFKGSGFHSSNNIGK